MSNIEILVPDLPESVIDATVVAWHKKIGDWVERNEVIVDLETDKIVLEVPATNEGVLEKIVEKVGSIVVSKQLLGIININKKNNNVIIKNKDTILNIKKVDLTADNNSNNNFINIKHDNNLLTPTLRRLIAKYNTTNSDIENIEINKRLMRYDFKNFLSRSTSSDDQKNISNNDSDNIKLLQNKYPFIHRHTNRVPMTRIRKRIAERLLKVRNSTAMLTTFNEVNMYPIISLRHKYGEKFEEKYGVKLGFMSFFVKAVVEALKCYPELNSAIDGSDIIYHNYYDINIAVSTNRGLVTPVLQNTDNLSISEIEKYIKELAFKGRNDKLNLEELTGGTFTITNGGIFGSFMSTPIINPPQCAILGMHAIQDRAVVINGKIKILPMMYLALSYDHCLIDGRESVNFLVKIKKFIEDPNRLLLNI